MLTLLLVSYYVWTFGSGCSLLLLLLLQDTESLHLFS